ncbi:MAG: glycoside hydrolase family 28 protein [Saprospiraceae bacterium]|uniref:Glycoside hydrolase family 28 protein n=1 Tax=Candidatus Opimibacter skivensis TaxID=2982028 RepID=A0A9D7SST2_9BACT|nr:glycoside hydrolase family 28 protein [Candidatus Opimibacter skivensis]
MRHLLFIFILTLSNSILLSQDYNILDFGAKPDAFTLNTSFIQSAIDAASQNGGGRVIIPSGRFLSGSILLKTGVELHLLSNAVLLGSTDIRDYKKLHRWKALVMADNQTNIAITGAGEIDGQGRQLALHIDSLFYAGQIDSADYMFAEKRPKWYLRPQIIEFVKCRDIVVRNVTLRNAACWVQTYDQCHNITIDSVTVNSDAYWNNDGIDIQDCHNVRILHCDINSADDGICLKSQSRDHLCDSISITDCKVRSSASAIKFGAVSHGGFRNVIIDDIRIYDTFRSALAIECVDGGILDNVKVKNIYAVNTGNAIFIRLGDRNEKGSAGLLKNISITNMKVNVASGRPDDAYEIRGPELPFFHNTFPSSITGIPGHPVENVTLENIEINYPGRGNNGIANMPLSRLKDVPENEAAYPEFSMFGELPAWGFYVRHMDGLIMNNIRLNIQSPDYRPALIFDDVHHLDIHSMFIEGDQKLNKIILHNTSHVNIDKEQAVLKM